MFSIRTDPVSVQAQTRSVFHPSKGCGHTRTSPLYV
jgi:hypothetical protein